MHVSGGGEGVGEARRHESVRFRLGGTHTLNSHLLGDL